MTLSSDQATALAASVAEPLGSAGAAHYFHPDTLAKGKELGLGGMQFYMLGRGGVLGDVEPAVVTSAFGYFHISSVTKLWNAGREKLAPREAGRLYHDCCAERGRTALAEVEGLDAFCDAAEAVIAGTNPAGLALYAGLAAEPLADDVPGRALQLAAVLRELRGSAHLLALVATGIAPEVAHAVKRPEMVGPFGWDPGPDLSTFNEDLRRQAEDLTDRIVGAGLVGLSQAQADALVAGAAAIAAAVAQ